MKQRLASLLATSALVACATTTGPGGSRGEVEQREVGLFIPSAIGLEPPADRVIVLHRSGRTTMMEDAIIRRSGPTLRLEPVRSPRAGIEVPVEDVAAVEIERRAKGPRDFVLRERRVERSDTISGTTADFIGGALIGLVAFGIVALIVIESGD